MVEALNTLSSMIANWGIPDPYSAILARLTLIVVALVLSWVAGIFCKRYILKAVSYVAKSSKTEWDDFLVKRGVFHRIASFAPVLLLYFSTSVIFSDLAKVEQGISRLLLAYMMVLAASVVFAAVNAATDIYKTFPVSRERPIKSFAQLVKIFLFVITGILLLSILLDKSPWVFLSGLGAMTAVLMLVFKDSILGFVASIQLAFNNMVRPGDWIEMPQFGADGDVIEVSLHTVKIQNFDKTITTIPTYALISNSFKNWRGMDESGGRRIKRSIVIDMNTVSFCDSAMLEKLKKFELLKTYLTERHKEIEEYNTSKNLDTSEVPNGRQLTNVGIFRRYIEEYLRSNQHIYQEGMTFLVRQLAPGEKGLPIEIYVFSKVQAWIEYEAIQADIFDHILAVLGEFDLQVYQNPSGNDFRKLGN